MLAGSTNGSAAKNLPLTAPAPRRERQARPRTEQKPKVAPKSTLRRKMASVCLVLTFFALFVVVIMRFAYIDEVNSDLKTLKQELSAAKEETRKLRTQMNTTLSLDEVRTRAGTDLDMNTPGGDQKIYVTLPEEKQAPVSSANKTTEDNKQFQGIYDMLLGLLD
ncbi:MAG: hypothetical protein ACOYU3_08735 [Bacillota bacterium]